MAEQTLLDRRDAEDKLASTRQELIDLLRHDSAESLAEEHAFPRSRTMRLLLSSRGLGALAVTACGFLVSRPALALRLLRLVPLGTVARILAFRFFSAQGSKV